MSSEEEGIQIAEHEADSLNVKIVERIPFPSISNLEFYQGISSEKPNASLHKPNNEEFLTLKQQIVTREDSLEINNALKNAYKESKSPSNHVKRQRLKRYLGVLLTILSAMMFSINALIFKTFSSPWTPSIFMFAGTAILSLPLVIYKMISDKEDYFHYVNQFTLKVLMARAFTGCSGMLFFFYSLKYLNVGDALVIACSSSIVVFILAFIFLKESCGIVPILTIILALIGVVIITKPPLLSGEESFRNDDLIGAALAFSSMLFIASTLVLMRYLQNVHHSLINLIFGSWGTVQTLGLALAIGVLKSPDRLSDAALMATTGLFYFMGQTFLALALQLEDAGPVSLIRTSEVIFAFIWQYLFLNVYPDVFSITGAVLIMIGIVTTVLRKWVSSLPEDHSMRNRFNIILM